MRAARAIAISVILLLTLMPHTISSENDGVVTILEGQSEDSGPFWILFTCKIESCPGMELLIIADGESFHSSDTHHVEWSGMFNETIEWELRGSDSLGPEDFVLKSVSSTDGGIVEEGDLPDIVPSPGQNSEWISIEASSECQLNRCDEQDWEADGVSFTGSLQSSSDDDAILVSGKFGDVVKISGITSKDAIDIEFWSRGETKTLIKSISSVGFDNELLDYPGESELWIRVVHSSEGSFSPYELKIVRYEGDKEGPEGGELQNPWEYSYPLFSNSSIESVFRGHISTSDLEGDSILVSAGSKIMVNTICEFSGEISLDVVIHKLGNERDVILEDLDACPEYIQTPKSTTGVEFRMKSEGLTGWSIDVTSHMTGDGILEGDAPDFLWSETGPSEFWTYIKPGPGSISGSLGIGDSVDIHPLEITDENGSLIFIRPEMDSPVTYQIQELNPDSWQILNYTNGSIISIPKGNHAIRVEGLSPILGEVDYEFTILYLGENIPDEGEYRDLSHLFTNFYILIGFLMILPLLVVLWWNRSTILQRHWIARDNKKHDLERLKMLRRRLSESIEDVLISPREIENALGKLGESPWDGILEEWGNPDLRHMTDQIEVCAWRPVGVNFLIIGIRTFEKMWELTAINLNSPEGTSVEIRGVEPSYLCEGGDVFLDSLEPHSRKFLRVSIGGTPSSIELEVSGLVDGEPLAAVPREALLWNEEE